MSFVRARTNAYGPATLDIQIEQGCDIDFSIALGSPYPTDPLDITGYTFTAVLSPEWSPGASAVPMTVGIDDASMGIITVSLDGDVTLDANFPLPAPPRKTAGDRRARQFALGGWALFMTDTSGFRTMLLEGDVMLMRDPTAGG